MDTATGLRRCADEATARHLRFGQVVRSQSMARFGNAALTLCAELVRRWLRWD
jgi:hypothetical protein